MVRFRSKAKMTNTKSKGSERYDRIIFLIEQCSFEINSISGYVSHSKRNFTFYSGYQVATFRKKLSVIGCWCRLCFRINTFEGIDNAHRFMKIKFCTEVFHPVGVSAKNIIATA